MQNIILLAAIVGRARQCVEYVYIDRRKIGGLAEKALILLCFFGMAQFMPAFQTTWPNVGNAEFGGSRTQAGLRRSENFVETE